MKRLSLVLAALMCVAILAPAAQAARYIGGQLVSCSYFNNKTWQYIDRNIWAGEDCTTTDLLGVNVCYARDSRREKILVFGRAFEPDHGWVAGNALQPTTLTFRGKKNEQRCALLFFQSLRAQPADQVEAGPYENAAYADMSFEFTTLKLNSYADGDICQLPDEAFILLLRRCSDGSAACPNCGTPCSIPIPPN